MGFWSGERLLAKGATLFPNDWPNSADEKIKKIDCAAYRLTLGREAYITQEVNDTDPQKGVKLRLEEGSQFRIPAGQFAFVLTKEWIEIPAKVIGFISVRSKVKLRGLVNVSGFHVDPGYKGQLVFGVYNAGPTAIHLERGQPLFLMWCADLECSPEEEKAAQDATRKGRPFTYTKQGFDEITSAITGPMTGNVFSPTFLASELKQLRDNVIDLREKVAFWNRISWALLIFAVGVVVRIFFWPSSP